VQAADIITSVVDRISDLIDGFGGVYGILFQIGNFVAQHFVNKTPQFIQDLTKDIDILTGKTTQSLIKVQEEYS
jgi:phage-related protein